VGGPGGRRGRGRAGDGRHGGWAGKGGDERGRDGRWKDGCREDQGGTWAAGWARGRGWAEGWAGGTAHGGPARGQGGRRAGRSHRWAPRCGWVRRRGGARRGSSAFPPLIFHLLTFLRCPCSFSTAERARRRRGCGVRRGGGRRRDGEGHGGSAMGRRVAMALCAGAVQRGTMRSAGRVARRATTRRATRR
jgi:hypothetical protein